jgi:hypothetical protein
MGRRWIAAAALAAAGVAGFSAAQETEFRSVSNPFQEGYPYRIGEDLAPGVEIDDFRWTLVRLITRAEGEIEPGEEIALTAELEFENRREDGVRVLVVLLLEDQRGNPVERLQFSPFRAGGGRFKVVREKFKLPGDVLLATEGLYLFCEIQE